jgi:hypothetical protein
MINSTICNRIIDGTMVELELELTRRLEMHKQIDALIVPLHKKILALRAIERMLEKINYQDYDNRFTTISNEEIDLMLKCIEDTDDSTMMSWYKMKCNNTIVNIKTLRDLAEMRGVIRVSRLTKEELTTRISNINTCRDRNYNRDRDYKQEENNGCNYH